MKKRGIFISILAGVLILLSGSGIALASEEENEATQQETTTEEREYLGIVGIIGTESDLEAGRIIVETKSLGIVEVMLGANTTYKAPGQDEVTKTDLEIGKRVAILATVDDNEDYVALRVMLVPGEPTRRHLGGVVVSIEDGIMTIMNANGETMTVELPDGVKGGVVGDFISAAVRQNEGKTGFVARGLQTAADVKARLQTHLNEVAGQRVATQAEVQKRDQVMKNLEERLEGLCDNNTDVLERIIAKVSVQARTAMQAAIEKSEQRFEQAQTAIRNARGVAGGRGRNNP